MQSDNSGPWSFQRSAQSLEDRLSAWPMWKKIVILVPAVVLMSCIVVVIIGALGYGIPLLVRSLFGH